MLAFQRLDVYRCAVRFLGLSTALASRLPRGHAELADQLKRASLSIPLNVAEGSGKTGRDGGRYYVIARGSAMECAAILDAMVALELIDGDEVNEARELIERMVAMLTKMRGEAVVRGR